MAYSTDGITWKAGTMPSDSGYDCVAYGGGRFVAIGIERAAYSADGITWHSATYPDSASDLNCGLTYGNGKFVSVYRENVYYSTNGVNWITTTIPLSNAAYIAYGGGKFVAVSMFYDEFAYSTDGIQWIAGEMPYNSPGPHGNSYWEGITYGMNKFISVYFESDGGNKAAYCLA